MNAEDASAGKLRRLRRYYAAFAALSGSSRVVDKYPELIFRDGLVSRAFPDARRIVILRDGWQASASIAQWSRRHGANGTGWWGRNGRKWHVLVNELIRRDPYFAALWPDIDTITRQEDMAALEWTATMREALALRRKVPDKVHFLRFEDLVTAPAAHTAELLDFCGLPLDKAVLRYAADHLKPPPPHPRPALHPQVENRLAETMRELGYGDPA